MNSPETNFTLVKARNNRSGWQDINFADIQWTTTKPSNATYLGYDKTTDTLYGSSIAPNTDREYYADIHLDIYEGIQGFPLIENAWNTTITGASKIIPSLLNIN